MTPRTLLLATAVSAGSIVLTIGPADAQTVRHLDARHDVLRSTGAFEDNETKVPNRTQGDITWVRATYSKHSLFLSMRFRKLAKLRRTEFHLFSVQTSNGKERDALVNSGSRYPRGVAVLSNDQGYLHCRIQHRVSYRHAIVTVTIPARCLDDASWVRVGFGEADYPLNPSNPFGNGTEFNDDGYASYPSDGIDDTLVYGPEVHRG
jgi:hypothetical protein